MVVKRIAGFMWDHFRLSVPICLFHFLMVYAYRSSVGSVNEYGTLITNEQAEFAVFGSFLITFLVVLLEIWIFVLVKFSKKKRTV